MKWMQAFINPLPAIPHSTFPTGIDKTEAPILHAIQLLSPIVMAN